MKAEGADKIEEEKRLAVESLTGQLARSREEIATLIEAKVAVFAFKSMDFVRKMMNLAVEMMDFVLKVMT